MKAPAHWPERMRKEVEQRFKKQHAAYKAGYDDELIYNTFVLLDMLDERLERVAHLIANTTYDRAALIAYTNAEILLIMRERNS